MTRGLGRGDARPGQRQVHRHHQSQAFGSIAEGDLAATNRAYIRMNLTMGGVADMLALAYGYLLANGEIAECTPDHLGTARSAGLIARPYRPDADNRFGRSGAKT